MRPRDIATSWHVASRIGARQADIIATGQLQACGLSEGQLARAVRDGRLHREGRGVYRMSATPPTERGRWWIALVTSGPHALLSHRTVAIGYAALSDGGRVVHITAPGRHRSRAGVVMHEATLRRIDCCRHGGLPMTSVARTALDVAATEPEVVLAVVVRQILTRHPTQRRAMIELLERCRGHKGRGPLRAMLAELAHDHSRGDVRSTLERDFWLALRPVMRLLPPYTRNTLVGDPSLHTISGDLVFGAQRVIVELDSRDYHDNDPSFDSDRRRDLRLTAAGWTVVRITPRHLRDDRDGVIADLLAVLGVL